MSASPLESASLARRSAPWVLLASVFAVVVASHVAAVSRCPLPVYGDQGAEYLEHSFREQTCRVLEDRSLVGRLWRLPGDLAGQDETYPALLHLAAAAWGAVFGTDASAAIHMNLPLLLLLAASVAWATRRFPTVLGLPACRWEVVAAASAAVPLLPAVFATARRYYYDLPSTALATLALAALLGLPRSTPAACLAAVATATALLTKWTAGFYLVGPWLLAAALVGLEVHRRRVTTPAARLVGAALLVVMLCSPALRNSRVVHGAVTPLAGVVGLGWELDTTRGSSLDTALGLGSETRSLELDGVEGVRTLAGRVGFYGRGLVGSSLGPLVAAAILVSLGLGYRRWRLLVLAAALGAPPIGVLLLKVDVLDERFLFGLLPLLMVAVGAGLDAAPWERARAAVGGALIGAGLLQLAAVDGRLDIGPTLTPRSPIEHRGWSLVDEVPCSPLEDYGELVRRACAVQEEGGVVVIVRGVAEHAAMVWMLERYCDEGGVVTLSADEVAAWPPPGTGPLARRGAAITAEPLAAPWPEVEMVVPAPVDRGTAFHLQVW